VINATEILVTNYTTGDDRVSLSTFGACTQLFSNMIGIPELSGGSEHLPGRPGVEFIKPEIGARQMSIGIVINGYDAGNKSTPLAQKLVISNLRALGRLLWSPNQPLLLTRVLDDDVLGGPPTEFTTEAVMNSDSFAPDLGESAMALARQVLSFTLLPGFWLGEEQTFGPVAPGSYVWNVISDDRTRFISININPGPGNIQIVNTTTDYQFHMNQDPPNVNPVDIDVVSYRAVDSAHDDMYSRITANGDAWMVMSPGDNNMSISGGPTALITMTVQGVFL
jgi:hypothetical protein